MSRTDARQLSLWPSSALGSPAPRALVLPLGAQAERQGAPAPWEASTRPRTFERGGSDLAAEIRRARSAEGLRQAGALYALLVAEDELADDARAELARAWHRKARTLGLSERTLAELEDAGVVPAEYPEGEGG